MSEESTIRLNKYLAMCGVCSRREADRLIEAGRVVIDGVIATNGERVCPNQQVSVDGEQIAQIEEKVVLAYHKPVGVTCTHKDQYAKRTVIDEIAYEKRITYAGRLDKDSEGLLIMTNDGTLIQEMMRSANGHEKEYEVKLSQKVTKEFIDVMKAGVYLEELGVTTKPCKVEAIDEYSIRIVLTQGLNRQIRRMAQACNNEVVRLKRVRIMNIELGTLETGTYRVLAGAELASLYQLVLEV